MTIGNSIIELWDSSGGKGHVSPTSCSKWSPLWGQTRLLRALSSLLKNLSLSSLNPDKKDKV